MHKSILDATIASVRLRDSQGDCPTEPAFSVEHLEGALLTLAGEMAQPADAVREALEEALRRVEYQPGDHPIVPIKYAAFKGDVGAALERFGAKAPLASDPAPAGEAVEPVVWGIYSSLDGRYTDLSSDSEDGARQMAEEYFSFDFEIRPLYAHPAPEDTARLREDLERAIREAAQLREAYGRQIRRLERERDDARKALGEATDDRERLVEAHVWRTMDSAPLDGKHCILALESGCYILSAQGFYHGGKWITVLEGWAGEPLAWMPNVLLPDELCPERFRRGRAVLATEASR